MDRENTIVRKAIVPVAGLGTRHFPASHAVKKELFPVVGPDGVNRALIHYHVLELVKAGVQEICIIVQPGEDEAISSYFDGPGDAYLRRLEKYPALLHEAEGMRGLSQRIRFIEQKEQEGFGHAVFQGKRFAAGEMTLLCLGDHLFRGGPVSPYSELAATSSRGNGRSVSAVNRIGLADLKGYGTIAGTRRTDDPRLIDVQLIVEKPSVEEARRSLRVDGMKPDEFLGWFGMHALAPSIFDILERMIRDDIRNNGEFQLTRAQELQRQQEGYLALEMVSARRFDFGVPDDFVRSVAEFRRASFD
jgi:UTP--glucose-1-phosphate uridylyltransferase